MWSKRYCVSKEFSDTVNFITPAEEAIDRTLSILGVNNVVEVGKEVHEKIIMNRNSGGFRLPISGSRVQAKI